MPELAGWLATEPLFLCLLLLLLRLPGQRVLLLFLSAFLWWLLLLSLLLPFAVLLLVEAGGPGLLLGGQHPAGLAGVAARWADVGVGRLPVPADVDEHTAALIRPVLSGRPVRGFWLVRGAWPA